MDSVSIRRGSDDDLLAVTRLFDAAVLETDRDRLRRQLAGDSGFVLLATTEERAVGAVAVETELTALSVAVDFDELLTTADSRAATGDDREPAYITAIAVRNSRQNRGIGRQLLEAAISAVDSRSLVATFSEASEPFYRACGFEIESRDGRLWGVRWPASA